MVINVIKLGKRFVVVDCLQQPRGEMHNYKMSTSLLENAFFKDLCLFQVYLCLWQYLFFVGIYASVRLNFSFI